VFGTQPLSKPTASVSLDRPVGLSKDPTRPAGLIVPLSTLPARAIFFTLGDSMTVAEYKLDELLALFVAGEAVGRFGF